MQPHILTRSLTRTSLQKSKQKAASSSKAFTTKNAFTHTYRPEVQRQSFNFTKNFNTTSTSCTRIPKDIQKYDYSIKVTVCERLVYQGTINTRNLNNLNGAFHRQSRYQTGVVKPNTRSYSSSNSSKNADSAIKAVDTISKRKKFLKHIAKFIKIVRIPTLVFSVYSIGYTAGISEYMRSPAAWKKHFFESAIKSAGCDDPSQVFIATEGQWKTQLAKSISGNQNETPLTSDKRKSQRQLFDVAYVGEKIIQSARILVTEKLTKYYQMIENGVFDDEEEDECTEDLIEKWEKAYQSLDTDGGKWKFVLLDVPTANAFVSETTPHTIFITTAMMNELISNDDELGLVLGHEISHLLLAHTTGNLEKEKNLKTIEVLLLTLDPTEGLLSVFVMGLLAYLRKLLSASHSRHNEHEADELGIKIAAMSCFDTRRAPEVFARMHKYEVESYNQLDSQEVSKIKDDNDNGDDNDNDNQDVKEGHQLESFMATHPPTLLRYSNLRKMSKEENPDKYPSECQSTMKRFFKSLKMLN